MAFVQIIDCKTDHMDDLNQLMDTWVERSAGRRTATHSIVATDRADAGRVLEIVEFPSYEEAMRNSQLPETDEIFERMVAICLEPPSFTDLDVVRDEQFNKATARRFFEDVVNQGNLDVLDEILAPDYHDHDIANEQDTIGPAGIRDEVSGYVAAFDPRFTIEDQIAEGDRVSTRWSLRGVHRGDFLGASPTGKEIISSGVTIMRLGSDNKIHEGWWYWDLLGVLRQIDVVSM